jgi:hypothetical protein
MNIKKFAAYSALVGGMSLATLGFGAGAAHADTVTMYPGNGTQIIRQIEQHTQQSHAQDPSGGATNADH